MKKLLGMVMVFGLASVLGCETKSGTAPSTDPNKPKDVQKLTLTSSGDHTITQGETDDVMVNINRDNFKEPVTFDVKDLPRGVTLDSKDLTAPADKGTFTLRLKAAVDAPPTKDAVFHITGKSGDVKAELTVKLTVKAK